MLHLSAALTAYILAMTALLGLVAGSFLNCLAWRLSHGESVLRGRSHCARCGHTLGAGDLIPVVSYLMLKGRCRWCGEKISPRYPLTELSSMLIFLGIVLRYDVTFQALRLLILCCILLAAALVDLEIKLIPDRLLVSAALWYLITLPLVSGEVLHALWSGVKGGLAVFLPLLAFTLLADRIMGRETMGGGDLKLFFTVGLYLGLPLNLLNLITSCVLGVIFGICTGGLRAQNEDARAIPFGPAIAAGTYLTLLCGDKVLTWYLNLFF